MNFLLFMLIPGTAAFFLMKKEKNKLSKDQVAKTPLKEGLFWGVLLLNILAPIVASSIFYYGWKKKLPKKAKTANNLGWLAILFWFVVYYFFLNK